MFRITVEPASNIADPNIAYSLRKMWSRLLKVPIESILLVEAVTLAASDATPSTTRFNVTDPANTMGNAPGINTTAAIVNSVQTAAAGKRLLSPGGADETMLRRRRSLAGIESDSAKLDLIPAASRAPTTGASDVSVNILSSSKNAAAALATTVLALTPDEISAGVASTSSFLSTALAPPGMSAHMSRRLSNGSIFANFTVGVDASSVQLVELSFVTKYWGVFLDFLLKNIQYVIGGSVALILYNVGLAYYQFWLAKTKKRLAEEAAAAAQQTVDDAKRALKFRILRARFRVFFRRLARDFKDGKTSAERREKTAAREAKMMARLATQADEEAAHIDLAVLPPPPSAAAPRLPRNPVIPQSMVFAAGEREQSPATDLVGQSPAADIDAEEEGESVAPPPPIPPLYRHQNPISFIQTKTNLFSVEIDRAPQPFEPSTILTVDGEIAPASPDVSGSSLLESPGVAGEPVLNVRFALTSFSVQESGDADGESGSGGDGGDTSVSMDGEPGNRGTHPR